MLSLFAHSVPVQYTSILLNFVFTTFDDALEAGGAQTVCS